MAKLRETARDFASVADVLTGKLDEIRLAQDSLAQCAEVFQLYTTTEPANEYMDADKARNQLLDSIFRILQV
jgi:hypothetical protein